MLQELSEDLLLTLERKDLEQADLCELFTRERLSPGPRREADRRSTKSPTCEAFIRLSEARGVISQITLMNGEKILVHDDFEEDVVTDERRDEPAPGAQHVPEATSPDESVLISNTTCSEMMNMHKLLHDSSEPEVSRESFVLVTNAASSKSLPCNSLLRSALTGKAPLNNNNNNNNTMVFGQKEPYRSEEKKVDEILLFTTAESSKDTIDRIKEEVCESASKYVITTAEGPVVHMESVEIAIDHNSNRRRYIRRPRGGSGSSDETSAKKEARMLHHCHICNKGFKDRYSVNVHIRTHTGEKPFACSLCGKCFRQKAHLAKHHQTHAAKQALMDQQTNVATMVKGEDNNNGS